jgi:hypothetical protein
VIWIASLSGSQLIKLEHHRELEDEVNAWLEQNPGIKVMDIKQSSSGGSWVKP